MSSDRRGVFEVLQKEGLASEVEGPGVRRMLGYPRETRGRGDECDMGRRGTVGHCTDVTHGEKVGVRGVGRGCFVGVSVSRVRERLGVSRLYYEFFIFELLFSYQEDLS